MTESSIQTGVGVSNVNGRWIEDMFAAIDASDWAALPAFFHPGMVYERPGYDPFVGRDRVMRFYREERVIQSGSHTLDGTIVENGKAAAWGRIDAVHTNGTAIGFGFSDVYLFEQGAIKLRRSHFFVPAV
jgi:ketosteroid isomerase-like protein